MNNSSLPLFECICLVDEFLPIKITFNDIVLYNDYDGEETRPPLSVIPDRIQRYRKSIVESIEIEIVQFHHSIIHMHGKLVEG